MQISGKTGASLLTITTGTTAVTGTFIGGVVGGGLFLLAGDFIGDLKEGLLGEEVLGVGGIDH